MLFFPMSSLKSLESLVPVPATLTSSLGPLPAHSLSALICSSSSTQSLTPLIVMTWHTIFFQLHFDQFPTAYRTHSTFAETTSSLVPKRPTSNFLQKCPQATPSRLGPPSRECAHPGGLTSSAQLRFVGPVGTGVEYSTQWSGKATHTTGACPRP